MAQTTTQASISDLGSIYDPTTNQETFKSDNYSIDSLMYPDDLLSNTSQYGGNYVVFFIKVHEDSYLLREGKETTVNGGIAPRNRGFASGLSETGIKTAGAVGGAAAGLAAGAVTKAVGTFSKAASVAGATTKSPFSREATNIILAGANALAGAGAAMWIMDKMGGVKKEYKQIKTAIALYVPTDLATRYSASWDDTSLAGSNALATINENTSVVFNSYLTGMALKTPGPGELISKTSGTVANPKKEQLFQNVDFRTFTMNYQFFPRSKEEAKNIQRIIKAFKLHMHPEFRKDSAEFLYLYPSEFDVLYFNNGVENNSLHKHTSCVLTDMNVNYSTQNQFTTFEDGTPVQINVSLTFKELALLTKDAIEDGY